MNLDTDISSLISQQMEQVRLALRAEIDGVEHRLRLHSQKLEHELEIIKFFGRYGDYFMNLLRELQQHAGLKNHQWMKLERIINDDGLDLEAPEVQEAKEIFEKTCSEVGLGIERARR